jgi:HSP20 family protein
MGLVKVNPNLVNRVFDEFFQTAPAARPVLRANLPAVNVKETDEGFELEVAAPGFHKEDIKIEVNEGVLTISGAQKTDATEPQNGYTRREFHYANFTRRFTLPETADEAQISAQYHNGILNVVLPKKEEAKPQPARLIAVG